MRKSGDTVQRIMFTGSRSWTDSATITSVLTALRTRRGADAATICVGCAVGVDELVVRHTPATQLRISCVGDPLTGIGCWRSTARQAIGAAHAGGAQIVPWAGGGPDMSLTARLARRSAAMVRDAVPGKVVAFVAAPLNRTIAPRATWHSSGSGTWSTLALAVGLGCPALLVPLPGSGITPPLWPGYSWKQGTIGGVAAFVLHPD